MQPRRSLRLVAGALVLALPLLSSCGFGKATDTVYTPAAGTNDRDQDIKILSAVVVSAQPGSGTFIATMSNNEDDGQEPTTFEGLTGAGDWSDLEIGEFEPIEVPVRDFVNLAEDGGVPVTGEFAPGDFVELSLSFANGQTSTMEMPVVYACDEWSGLDTSAGGEASAEPSASESPSPSEEASASPTEEAGGEDSGDESSPTGTETSTAPDTEAGDDYTCTSTETSEEE